VYTGLGLRPHLLANSIKAESLNNIIDSAEVGIQLSGFRFY
jgi:hypothetical protein